MKFFNQNIKHDKVFIELQTKLNFSYWIASDVNHYYENTKEIINAYQYKKLLKQYQTSIDIFKSVDVYAADIGRDQKTTLYALSDFVKGCIKFSDISDNKSQLDSESQEINLLNMLNIEREFQNIYLKYLHPDELESLIMKSYIFLENGVESLMKLTSQLEFDDQKEIKNLSFKILNDLKLSRECLDSALQNPSGIELMFDELIIITGGTLSKEDVSDFSKLNFDYIKLLKEYVMVHERYFENLINDKNIEDNDENLFDFECNNYLASINVLAIKLNLFIFKKMEISVPQLEIFSQRIIKSPIDYIQRNIN